MPSFTFNGLQMHYCLERKNKRQPTLVFIHDLGLDKRMWERVLPYLRQDFSILTYDLPGHGQSGSERDEPSLDRLSDELKGLLDDLQLSHVHLIGCRYGAFLACAFARRMPGRIDSLTAVSIPLSIGRQSYSREEMIKMQLLTLDPQLFEKKYLLESLHPVTLSKARTVIRALRCVRQTAMTAAIRKQMLHNNRNDDFSPIVALKRLSIPILFINGEYDPVFPPPLSMILSSYAPNGRSVVVADASSLVPLDQPQEAAETIRRFINGDRSPSFLIPGNREDIRLFHRIIEEALRRRTVHRHVLSLRLLSGKTELFWNGRKIAADWKKRNAQEILLFLALNHGTVKRDTLIDAFMPDLPLSQARNRLRVQLNYLKKLFSRQPDDSFRRLLLVGRYSVALTAPVESDIGDFIDGINALTWSRKSAGLRCEAFLSLLDDYRPDLLATFKGAWFRQLAAHLRNKLSQTMVQLILALKKNNDFSAIRSILVQGKSIEPYHHFCTSWLKVVDRAERSASRRTKVGAGNS